jgi:hypothetical protein
MPGRSFVWMRRTFIGQRDNFYVMWPTLRSYVGLRQKALGNSTFLAYLCGSLGAGRADPSLPYSTNGASYSAFSGGRAIQTPHEPAAVPPASVNGVTESAWPPIRQIGRRSTTRLKNDGSLNVCGRVHRVDLRPKNIYVQTFISTHHSHRRVGHIP